METVTSKDGTTIAYETTGSGPILILVAGALTERADMRPLAEALSGGFTVVNFDRRSRGDSDDARDSFPESVEHEIEDIEALVAAVGGPIYLYGHSSGASLALHAATRISPERLVLHEAPYHPDSSPDDESISGFSQSLEKLFAEGDDEGSVILFFKSGGITDEQIEEMKKDESWSSWVAKGRALAYDSVAMGDRTGGRIPTGAVSQITCPTLALAGSETYDSLLQVSRELADHLPAGEFLMVGGANHESGPDLIAPPVRSFLSA